MSNDNSNAQNVRIAVEFRDEQAVRAAIASGNNIEERNEIGDTPFLTACASGQFVIAEILLDTGADIFAHDHFGSTAGKSIEVIAIESGNPDGDARLRVRAKMEARGFPFPAPNADKVLDLAKAGQWPPARQ